MLKQKLISRYAKKFANASENHVTRGVHYAADGSVFVTNRHYALRIKNAHRFDSATTICVKTGMPINEKYPSFDKVFPSTFLHEIALPSDLTDVLLCVGGAVDVAKRVDKKCPIADLAFENGMCQLAVSSDKHHLTYKAHFGILDDTSWVPSIRLNPEYLFTGLKVFQDVGNACKLKFSSSSSPLVLTEDRDIDVLILPYRVPEQ